MRCLTHRQWFAVCFLSAGWVFTNPLYGSDPVFDDNSSNIRNRYMVWESGMKISFQGFGAIVGVTVEFDMGPIETVDGVACLKIISDRSNDVPQHLWLAQDTERNIWQLQSFDELTEEFHEEDVLYMPANPKVGEIYDLWDITFDSKYTVIAVDVTIVTPLQTYENCLKLKTIEDGVVEETIIAPLVGLVRTEAFGDPGGGFEITGLENFNPPVTPFISVQPQSQEIIIGAATRLAVHAVGPEAATYQWYRGEKGDTSVLLVGETNASYQTPIVTSDSSYWVRVSVGGETLDSESASLTAVPDEPGPKLYGFGSNLWGQLGLGRTDIDPQTSTLIRSGVVATAAGSLVSFFITSDGTLMGTGRNTDGQLGDGTVVNFLTTPIVIDTGVTKVATGSSHTFYIKSDGTLWGIGNNNRGQLGDGSTTRRTTPVQIATDVIDVSAGILSTETHSLFVKSDGTLLGMGYNISGQLGDGTTTTRESPIVIDTDVKLASAGGGHSHYLKSDGRLYSMGWNQFGQLGDKTFETRKSPVLIDTDVKKVSAGNNQSFYLKIDGTLMAMGSNILGNGPETNDPVIFDTEVADVDAGIVQNGVYIKNGGTMYSLKDKSQVLQNVYAVSVGSDHTLYLQENPVPLTAIRVSAISFPEPSHLLIDAIPDNILINYNLYSSHDLSNWSLHPIQSKSLQDSILSFDISNATVQPPHFFQVLGAD